MPSLISVYEHYAVSPQQASACSPCPQGHHQAPNHDDEM